MSTQLDVDSFVRARPRLFGLARRIVGNAHEAEDVVQEVWVRWQGTDRAAVRNADAFLATATARLAINVRQSARRRHETSVAIGPEREPAGPGGDPAAEAERGEAIELAARLLIERLPASERGAYLLREGFGYPYREIAQILHIGPDHARQLVSRARARIAAGARRPADSPQRGGFVRAFAAASLAGEIAGLEALLAAAHDAYRNRAGTSNLGAGGSRSWRHDERGAASGVPRPA